MSTPTIRLNTPAQIAASLPYLLGFTPQESLALLWLRDGGLWVTQRVDLPASLDHDEIAAYQEGVFGNHVAEQADGVIPVVVTANTGPAADRVLAMLTQGMARQDQMLDRGLITDLSIVRGYGRSETEAVHNLDSPLASGTQRPVHNRVQLEKEYAPADTITEDALAAQRDGGSRDLAWIVDVLDDAGAAVLAGDSITEEQTAALMVAFEDIRARDLFVGRMAHCDTKPVAATARLAQRSPENVRATCATIAALAAYLSGDGVRANIALDVALSVDPENSLAQLVAMSIKTAVSPQDVREMLKQADVEVVA